MCKSKSPDEKKKYMVIHLPQEEDESDNPGPSSQPSTSSVRDEVPSSFLGEDAADTLCQQIKSTTDIQELAGSWKKTLRDSPSEGRRSMFELILHSAGYAERLSLEQALMMGTFHNQPKTTQEVLILMSLTPWFQIPDRNPPILDELYMENLLKFILLTVVEDGCLYDTLIMEMIQHLLVEMSTSARVSVRYTSLMIGSTITRQLSAYWSKLIGLLVYGDGPIPDNRGNIIERARLVKRSLSMFMVLVELGLRDLSSTIRETAYEIFCGWCVKFDPLLMTDYYFDYICWAFSDDSPTIRGLAVMTCNSLYKFELFVAINRRFVNRTFPYVVTSTADIDTQVAAAAFETLSQVYRSRWWPLMDVMRLRPILLLVHREEDPDRAAMAAEILHTVMTSTSTSNTGFIRQTLTFVEMSLRLLHEDYYVDIGDNVFRENICSVLAKKLFLHAHENLTDWNAWSSLLLGHYLNKKKDLQELACILLLEVMKVASTYADPIIHKLPPDDKLVNEKTSHFTGNKEFKIECANHFLRVTTDLGPHLLLIWDKFSTNETCLTKLVAIPQYFDVEIDNLDMEIRQIWDALAKVIDRAFGSAFTDSAFRSMAYLYHLMSPKCDLLIEFEDVLKEFPKSCSRLKHPRTYYEEEFDLKVIEQVQFLTLYFDPSNTNLLRDVRFGLSLGVEVGRAKIICPTALTCLYILQWQVKGLFEGTLTGDELTARLTQIQSLSRFLVSQLHSLVHSERSDVRATVYSVLCEVYLLLAPINFNVCKYPEIHLSPPPLIKEWLNITFSSRVPQDVPKAKNEFELMSKDLQMFCFLLVAEVLDMSCISSILHYFKFYHHPKNYNNILEGTVRFLVKSTSFSCQVADSLVWMQEHSNDEEGIDVKEISKGLSTAALAKLAPKQSAETGHEIVRHGLSKIRNQSDLCILPILAPFLRLLNKRDKHEVYVYVRNTLCQFLDSEEVIAFLAAIDRRRSTKK